VDKNGSKRKIKSISITNVLTEGVVPDELAKEIIKNHLLNPKEFWSPYPFPAVAMNDPTWLQNLPGNSWGFYSQGLTSLRSLLWMDRYGFSKQAEDVMEKWLKAWVGSSTIQYGQELHPINGIPSESSQYYSSCMIYMLYAMKRLYNI